MKTFKLRLGIVLSMLCMACLPMLATAAPVNWSEGGTAYDAATFVPTVDLQEFSILPSNDGLAVVPLPGLAAIEYNPAPMLTADGLMLVGASWYPPAVIALSGDSGDSDYWLQPLE